LNNKYQKMTKSSMNESAPVKSNSANKYQSKLLYSRHICSHIIIHKILPNGINQEIHHQNIIQKHTSTTTR